MKQSLLDREIEFNDKWSAARHTMLMNKACDDFAIESRKIRVQAIDTLGLKFYSIQGSCIVFSLPYGGASNRHSFFAIYKSDVRGFINQVSRILNNRIENARVAVVTDDISNNAKADVVERLADKGYDRQSILFYDWDWFKPEETNAREYTLALPTHICIVGDVPRTVEASKVLSWIVKARLQIVNL